MYITDSLEKLIIRVETYLLKLGRAERVAELLAALGQRLSRGQVGHQPLLHLRVGQDGSHDVRRQDAGQVHYRWENRFLHLYQVNTWTWACFLVWLHSGCSPPWLLEGTFMVARMLCRSLSWMGWAGLADAPACEDGAGVEGVVAVGEAVEVAEGVMGVVGTCEELTRLAAEVEVGVAAVDGLEGKCQEERKQQLKSLINLINIYAWLKWIQCWSYTG